MRTVEISRTGAPDVLKLRERPDPVPRTGEIVLNVRAAGVNFADIAARLGLYPDAPKIPFVPGYEVSGTTPDGRRVVAVTRFQGYADRVLVRPDQIFSLPDNFSFEEGAAIPVNYLTAWVALVKMARLVKGEQVLVEQGAGGVGLAALQIALHHGAEVWSVVGSDDKAKFVKERGAKPLVRGRDPWPKPVDVILDPTGTGGIARNVEHLSAAGRMILYGASDFVTGKTRNLPATIWKYVTRARIDPFVMMNQNYGVYGLNVLHYWSKAPGQVAEGFAALEAGMRAGWLRPHVGATFPLERAAEAHAYIQERRNFGKVVLTCPS